MRLKDVWPWLRAEFRWRVLGKKYEIVITEEVQKTLDEIPKEVRAVLMKEFDRIARNPYSGHRVEIECEHCPLAPGCEQCHFNPEKEEAKDW